MLLSLAGFGLSLLPLFFISNALQPVVASSIAGESAEYFGFLVIGFGVLAVVAAAMSALPATISGNISSGTFEALLSTPLTMTGLVVGLSSYALLWSFLRACLIIAGAVLIGMNLVWQGIPAALLILALLATSYFTVALVAAALVLAFRTSGPLITGVITLSSLLGGVYYSTSVIPSWIQNISAFVPLTYGLRAIRRVLLTGASLADVWDDVMILSLFAAVLLAGGSVAFYVALRHSRRCGTLAQY